MVKKTVTVAALIEFLKSAPLDATVKVFDGQLGTALPLEALEIRLRCIGDGSEVIFT